MGPDLWACLALVWGVIIAPVLLVALLTRNGVR